MEEKKKTTHKTILIERIPMLMLSYNFLTRKATEFSPMDPGDARKIKFFPEQKALKESDNAMIVWESSVSNCCYKSFIFESGDFFAQLIWLGEEETVKLTKYDFAVILYLIKLYHDAQRDSSREVSGQASNELCLELDVSEFQQQIGISSDDSGKQIRDKIEGSMIKYQKLFFQLIPESKARYCFVKGYDTKLDGAGHINQFRVTVYQKAFQQIVTPAGMNYSKKRCYYPIQSVLKVFSLENGVTHVAVLNRILTLPAKYSRSKKNLVTSQVSDTSYLTLSCGKKGLLQCVDSHFNGRKPDSKSNCKNAKKMIFGTIEYKEYKLIGESSKLPESDEIPRRYTFNYHVPQSSLPEYDVW
jgi:hypothetical protein